MRFVSPFPYKVEIKNPNRRVTFSDLDNELSVWIIENTFYKDIETNHGYKRNLVNHWCNMMFGPDAWDFEYLENQNGSIIEYWLCFTNEENCTLTALKWN